MITDEMRLKHETREVTPCKGCTERFLACWDHCPKDKRGEYGYNAWKKNLEQMKEKHRQYVKDWADDHYTSHKRRY